MDGSRLQLVAAEGGECLGYPPGFRHLPWHDGAALAGPGADLAVFAASFHWTDRPAVPAVLDEVLAPGGAVVVINDVLGDSEQPDWEYAIARIRARYLGDRRRPGQASTVTATSWPTRRSAQWTR